MTRSRTKGERDERAANRKMTREKLDGLAEENPGKVAEVSAYRKLDLSSESGHVKTIVSDPFRTRKSVKRRVIVIFGAIGRFATYSEGDVKAGDLSMEDLSGHDVRSHVEFIDGRDRDEQREAVEEYLKERWDPQYPDRERVSPGGYE